jgi:GTPase
MKWRLREGNGEALYNIGVEDNGVMTGLSDEEMSSSLDTLQDMARRLGATVQVTEGSSMDFVQVHTSKRHKETFLPPATLVPIPFSWRRLESLNRQLIFAWENRVNIEV